ncbi:predicted protein, partial [Nematostella vectensis]
ELLASHVFVFLVCASCVSWPHFQAPSVQHIALTAGLTTSTLVMVMSHVTGGQINPAVAVAMVVTRRVKPVHGLVFVFSQVLGGLLGAALLFGLTPSSIRGSLGMTVPAPTIQVGQAVAMETILTFLLVFGILAATDERKALKGYEKAAAVGFCVFICHMAGIPFTGCSMNPARSLGPAVVMDHWRHHWVYWVGPFAGSILASLFYGRV